jgi:F0F1-type ATP synthase assembly protein I
MKRARSPSNTLDEYVNSLRRLPRPLFLIVGLILGFLIAQILQLNVSLHLLLSQVLHSSYELVFTGPTI